MADIAEIRATVTVPSVLEHLGVEAPDRIPGLIRCPVHDDDTPSLNVDEQVWYCHGCGQGGGAIELVMFVGGVSFRQALAYLEGAEDLLHDAPVIEQRPKDLVDLTSRFDRQKSVYDDIDSHAADELEVWCRTKWPTELVTPAVLVKTFGCKLGRENLWTPHRDHAGVVRGVKLRVMGRPNTGKKHAITDSTFTTRLYRIWERPWAPTAVLVEGESDTWTMSAHFWEDRQVAVYGMPCGVGTWKKWFADELAQHDAVFVFFDNDEAGRRGWEKMRRHVPHAVRYPIAAPAKDVTEAFAAGWKPWVYP